MAKIVNKVELAEILGRSERQLTDDQDEGLPIKHRGERGQEHRYDTATVIDWLIQRALARTGSMKAQLELESLELDVKKKRADEALRAETLVPADQVGPVWEGRVLAACAYMRGRASRLAGILEATPGIEAKRGVLMESDYQFLNHLGVHGKAMQDALDAFLAKCPPLDVQQLLHAVAIGVVLGN